MGSVQTGTWASDSSTDQYRLVVAIANPRNVDQLMRTAIDLVSYHEGVIEVVNVVHKPVTSPFHLFSKQRIKQEFADSERAVLENAAAIAERSDVPVRSKLLVGADVSRVLLSAVRDADADALLLGWQQRIRPSDLVLGTTVDPVIRRAPCDVYVERIGTTANGMDSILVPTDGGPHIESGIDLAGAVARSTGATVTIVSYVLPTAVDVQRGDAREYIDAAIERLPDVPVETDIRETTAVSNAIVNTSREYDLLVLGATRERRLRKVAVGSVAQSVSRRTSTPVVITKRGSEKSSLTRVLEYVF